MKKYFTAEEATDLVMNSNSHRTINFYGGKLPRGDHEIGSNYIDDEVVYVMEDGGGMRSISFCSSTYHEEGVLQTERPLPPREKILADIKSNAGFHGSLIEIRTGKEKTELGKVKSGYKRRKKNEK